MLLGNGGLVGHGSSLPTGLARAPSRPNLTTSLPYPRRLRSRCRPT